VLGIGCTNSLRTKLERVDLHAVTGIDSAHGTLQLPEILLVSFGERDLGGFKGGEGKKRPGQ
jgi:hypothetical protein